MQNRCEFDSSNSLHGVEVIPRFVDLEIVNGNDVGMLEVSGNSGFTSEALLKIGGRSVPKGLGGNDPVESFIVDLEDLAHAPGPQNSLDLITSYLVARFRLGLQVLILLPIKIGGHEESRTGSRQNLGGVGTGDGFFLGWDEIFPLLVGRFGRLLFVWILQENLMIDQLLGAAQVLRGFGVFYPVTANVTTALATIFSP